MHTYKIEPKIRHPYFFLHDKIITPKLSETNVVQNRNITWAEQGVRILKMS